MTIPRAERGRSETDVVPFSVRVSEAELQDLRRRLARTRWPEPQTVADWSQGVPLDHLQRVCAHWAERYDWRRVERRLNALSQYRTVVDGLGIHFVHVRSPHPDALPLVLTHGWPGSVLEFLDLVAPLTDPPSTGGRSSDAFDLVLPSLPGFGFSDKPSAPGCGVRRIAQTWADLMRRLGYDRYAAAGSDWGTSVSATLAELDSAHVVGAHLMPPLAAPDPSTFDTLTDAERASLESMEQRASHESAYSEIHRTRPQTIGYGLLDSPVLLCAWILEKWSTWTDGPLDVERSIGLDPVLDHVSWYWFTRTGASAARLYAESIADVSRWLTEPGVDVIDAPVGCSVFAGEVPRPSRRWAEKRFRDIRYWAEHDRGGHFAAVEVPELVVGDLRASFRELR